MPVSDFLETLLDEIDGKIRYATIGSMQDGKTVLGGTSGELGGTGAPLKGFSGKLIQTKIAYDTTEASLVTTSAAPSLLDNLNHIRYTLAALSQAVSILQSGTSNGGYPSIYGDNLSSQLPTYAFSLQEIPISGTVRLYYNGLRQLNSEFTVSGNILTVLSTLDTADEVLTDYEYTLTETTLGYGTSEYGIVGYGE
jgi:hypothetical protein